MRLARKHLFALSLSLLLGAVVVLPQAASALGDMADAMCTPVIQTCPCGQVPNGKGGCMPGQNMFMCPCWDVTSNYKTNGKCIAANTCRAESTGGKDGFGLDQVAKILGDLMGKLMQQGGGQQPGATPPTSGTPSGGSSGCLQTYQVTSPSTDPCAIYVPSVSDLLNSSTSVSTSLFDLLGSGTNTNTNTNSNSSGSATATPSSSAGQGNANTNTNTNVNTAATATPATTSVPVFANPAYLLPGLRGDIKVMSSGGTVIAGARDSQGNTEVAGFYGSDSFSGQPQGVVASLCRARPWSNNFLSFVLPANFFDSLCVARGYQVGNPAPRQQQAAPAVTVSQTKPRPVSPATSTASVSNVPAKVRIWSVPAAVPLGSRVSIFWTSQGVASCLVTSPDGSFSQTTLSGGASTVALTGATTFTISCLTPDGTPITDFVTVNLSI